MRILIKCPTRSRPDKVTETLRKYVALAKQKGLLGVAISCDEDDASMTRQSAQDGLHRVLEPVAWHRIFYSANKTKIQACNANMSEVDYPWDIVILVSDDMIPQVAGWDDVIRNHMSAYFPDTNGILWCNDGYQGDKLNTLSIYGRKMYDFLGNLYEPEYKSLFCDTELTDRCKGDLSDRCRYVPYCIIRHEHPGTGFAQNMDALYMSNQRFWSTDMHTYIRRKKYPYHWSVLIATIPGREVSLARLLSSIHEKIARICPEMTYEFCLAFDNREMSIGSKRQQLLEGAKGKYTSFIDDDDEITDAYIEDLWACIQGGYHTMRLWGQIAQYTFVHSTAITATTPMATHTDPVVFQRPPNHLNPMLADIAKFVRFKDAVCGEDLDWAISLCRTNFLQAEYRNPEIGRIHYVYTMGSRTLSPEIIPHQRGLTYDTMLAAVFRPAQPQVSQPSSPAVRTLRLARSGFVSK